MQLGIARRATSPGTYDHLADHHVVRVHTSAPVRVVCHRRELRRTRGQIDIMPAGAREAWRERDRGELIELALPVALVSSLAPSARVSPRFHVRDARIEELAYSLAAEARDGFPSGELYRDGLTVALIGRLVTGGVSPAGAPAPAGPAATVGAGPRSPSTGLSASQRDRVVDFIDASLASPISLVDLARIAGVSPSHLKPLFKRTFGIAPHAYVVRQRVERARRLLQRGELSIAEVAFEVGFAHPSHLARWTRRLLGAPPRALRR